MATVVPLSFYLDNDVDVTCAKVIAAAGYRCWSTSQAASQRSSDDEQTVYATDKGAVLITHDREFTNRRKKLPMGHHVRLVCHQMDGPGLLDAALGMIATSLAASPDMVLEVRQGRDGQPTVKAWFGSGANRPSTQG